jgi:hypothetical protein
LQKVVVKYCNFIHLKLEMWQSTVGLHWALDDRNLGKWRLTSAAETLASTTLAAESALSMTGVFAYIIPGSGCKLRYRAIQYACNSSMWFQLQSFPSTMQQFYTFAVECIVGLQDA